MAILYKVSKRAEPGVKGGGKNKYCAIPYKRQMIETDELADDIQEICTVHRVDLISVISALKYAIVKNMLSGHSVKLEGLGIFSVSFKVEMKDSAEEVTSRSIKEVRLTFRPDVELKKKLQGSEFVKHYERKKKK
jgi:predicted histone-like DNA-binding protein